MVKTSDKYFEGSKEQMTFFYPYLNLIQLDFFKMVKDLALVDEEDEVPHANMIPT